jgi:hypothetical protein
MKNTMVKFEVSLKLYFEEKSPEDCVDDNPEEEDQIYKSFDETGEFIMEDHLITLDLCEFVSYLCYLGDVETNSVKLLPNNIISFVLESYKETTTVEEIFDSFLTTSLEDGEYEAEEGWVIKTKDNKYDYGFIDYRSKENITVTKL